MNISIVTLFPQIYEPFLATSLLKRAQSDNLVSVSVHNLFSLCSAKERIDGPTFGHGAGVVIKPEIMDRAVSLVEQDKGKAYKIFFSPHGRKLDQAYLKELYAKIVACGHVALFPARYEGMDARVEEEFADEIISVGDFVLMGGDIPAMVLLEGLLRYVPHIVGKQESVEKDSFSGAFVDHPEYTAPVEWRGRIVPDVIRSGNHKEMVLWRHKEAAYRTVFHHFDWLRTHQTTEEENALVRSCMPSHYVALLHGQVLVPGPDGQVIEGTTSVTSIDIHDIARSAKTYGIKNYFVVTPLQDQQKIVRRLLDFWHVGEGVTYNPHRHSAVKDVDLMATLRDVIACIAQQEGVEPLVVVTSARHEHGAEVIGYTDQTKVWAHKRPVLFVFGTGRGLAASVFERADYILHPVKSFYPFNHLSVRSAAAIVLDRWLGTQVK